MSECGIACISSVLTIGFIWGATNPFIRSASVYLSDQQAERDDLRRSNGLSGIVSRFFRSFLYWRFSIPFAINQAASLFFNVLVAKFPVSTVVPCVNSIQIVSTVLVGKLIGEDLSLTSRRQIIGMLMSIIAIIGMLVVD